MRLVAREGERLSSLDDTEDGSSFGSSFGEAQLGDVQSQRVVRADELKDSPLWGRERAKGLRDVERTGLWEVEDTGDPVRWRRMPSMQPNDGRRALILARTFSV